MKPVNVIKSGALAMALSAGGVQASLLEFGIAIDGSGSISSDDFALQMAAYQDEFENDFWSTYVEPSIYHSVIVRAVLFGTGVTVLGTATISSDADALAFASVFENVDQPDNLTNIGQAILDLTEWMDTNGEDGVGKIIDVSTDGEPTTGPDAVDAANAARGDGITVNALGVGGVDTDFLEALVGLNPAASPQGFIVTADSFEDFATALGSKLEEEINGEVPVPATLALIGAGLIGFRLVRRRG